MRTANSIRNIFFVWGGQFFLVFFQFLNRFVFARTLDAEYLGASSLFTNILTILSLTELGFGTALSYSLYVPLALNDQAKIKSLMRLFRNVYRLIGFIIIFSGVVLLPIYPHLISGNPNIPNLDLIFILYVLNSGISYFFSYKTSLISCDQKQYIHSLVHYLSVYVMNLLQVAVLLLTYNFILYLVVQVSFTFIQNLIVSIVADKMYPFLKDKSIKPLEQADKAQIRRNVGAIVFHKMGDRLTSSGITIFVSWFINLTVTGIYSNYKMITDSVGMIVSQAFSAITGSVGNLEATESPERIYNTFNGVFFLNFLLVGFCSICLLCLIQPFIALWVGDFFLLNIVFVAVLVCNFYVSCMRRCVLVFRDASASYYYDRYKPIVEMVFSFSIAIICIRKIGIIGVPLATLLSQLLISTWVEAYVLHKHVMHSSMRRYIYRYFLYALITFIDCVVVYRIVGFVAIEGIGGFILKMLIAAFAAAVCLFASTFWMHEFKTLFVMIKRNLSMFLKVFRKSRQIV